MKNLNDDDLIEGYRATAKPEYITEIFFRYSDVAFRTARQFTGNEADAEDVVQGAFIKFMRDCKQYELGTNLKAWLMKIVVNTCRDKYKSEKRRTVRQNKYSERIDRVNYDEDLAEKKEMQKMVRSSVQMLPEKYRTPIWLVLFEGFSYSEASRSLEMPEKTLRTQVARGLDRLKGVLQKAGLALSIPVISSLIAETKLEAASSALRTKCASLATMKPSSSTVLGAIGPKASSALSLSLLIASVVMVLAAAAFYLMRPASKGMSSLPGVVKDKSADKDDFEDYLYSFDDGLPAGLKQENGEFAFSPGTGLGGSGSIAIKSDFYIKLKIPETGNVKISFKANYKVSPDGFGYTDCMPVAHEGMYMYCDLGAMTKIDLKSKKYLASQDSEWFHMKVYITDHSIAVYDGLGELNSYKICEKMQRKEVLLWVRSEGYLDDLKVEKTDEDPMSKRYENWLFEAELAVKTFGNKGLSRFILSDSFKNKFHINNKKAFLQIVKPAAEGELEGMLQKDFVEKRKLKK